MAPTYIPYERPPDLQALWTAIPRGLRGFVVNVGILDAKPINDDQLLTLSATLPNNFAYVFSEIHLTLRNDRAGDWRDGYSFNLQNWYQGQLSLSTSWNMPWTDGLVQPESGSVVIEHNTPAHSMDSLPRGPMWAPRGTSGILISIQAQNEADPASAAGTVESYISFWEFDLEQIRKFPINSPIPTHSR